MSENPLNLKINLRFRKRYQNVIKKNLLFGPPFFNIQCSNFLHNLYLKFFMNVRVLF